MGWLEEAEYEFQYRCPDGHLSIWEEKTCDKEPRLCLVCGATAEYLRFVGKPMLLRGKVAFEHNGRLGYQIRDGKGGVRYVSAAKEHYLETGDIKPAYSKAYREKLIAAGEIDRLIPYSRQEIIDERKARKAAASAASDGMLAADKALTKEKAS
jgi:hypothetical protein